MAEPNDPLGGLPDILRNSDRPIIIYQGPPPQSYGDARTNNALWLLAWLGLFTVCLGVAGLSAWAMWNPSFERQRFSPIYAEGHPRGLMKQVQERQQINAWTDRLEDFRDALRANNEVRRFDNLTHPLITDSQGIDLDNQGVDELRRRWDAMCTGIRARIYERRVSAIDVRAAQLARDKARANDPAELQRMNDALQSLRAQRADIVERNRTDTDPSLRCTPAAQVDMCSDSNNDAWCNPQLRHPEEFTNDGL